MIIIREKLDNDTFNNCAKYGKLENMKWLLKNNFPYNSRVFDYASKNENLENMK